MIIDQMSAYQIEFSTKFPAPHYMYVHIEDEMEKPSYYLFKKEHSACAQ
jgi:hypothetical protein